MLSTTTGRPRVAPAAASRRRWALPVAAVSAIALVATMVALFLRGQVPATAGDGRRSLAVFYFDNLSGDP